MPNLTMAGPLSECLLLSYRTPQESVAGLVPEPLELVARDGFAFWNVVACRIDGMRPAGLPKFLGVSYHHVAYRLLVSAKTADGGRTEGLFFVRSDADSALLSLGGNALTDFRFNRARIVLEQEVNAWRCEVESSDPAGRASFRAKEIESHCLADGSPFDDAKQAAKFLKYQPLGLAVGRGRRKLKLAEVIRNEAAWRERPLRIEGARWGFFEALGQKETALEQAVRVDPIPYRWRLGRTLRLAPPS